jgi:hypothetical protein
MANVPGHLMHIWAVQDPMVAFHMSSATGGAKSLSVGAPVVDGGTNATPVLPCRVVNS